MEDPPDNEPSPNIRFISRYVKAFSPEEVVLSDSHCSLVATSSKYGLVFAACGSTLKVYESKLLLEGEKDEEVEVLVQLGLGAQLTHVACSCDGLTLLALILHNDAPHALFYDVRNFVPGVRDQTPFVSVGVGCVGARVQGLAWNPAEPSSFALAVSPSCLSIITLTDSRVDINTKEVSARAVGWSPKGKQLTVGLADGSLALFKPDLTPVRTVSRPPMDGIGPVLSITWFTNTEFFIGYAVDVEQDGQMMFYVNAPKASEPKFVMYEYLCNYNQGSRPAMFYSQFFPEWSILCVLSSRANQVGTLGRPAGGGAGWCEYEMDEGAAAELRVVAYSNETFPLGMALDLSSQKVFVNKDESRSGPFPAICSLSTGGDLCLFHVANSNTEAQELPKPPQRLPPDGCRTPLQYQGICSYTVPAGGASPPAPPPTVAPPAPVQVSTPAPASAPAPAPALPMAAPLPAALPPAAASTAPASTAPSLLSGGFFSQTSSLFPSSSSSPFSPATPQASSEVGGARSLFGTKLSTPLFTPPQTASPATSTSFQVPAPPLIPKQEPTKAVAAVTSDAGQGLKLPSVKLPMSGSSSGSISLGKPAQPQPAAITPQKSKSPSPAVSDHSKHSASRTSSSVAHSPSPAPRTSQAAREADVDFMATITSSTAQFEEDLRNHKSIIGKKVEIGSKEEMASLRQAIGEEVKWVDQMGVTTSELKGEVAQLQAEVLDGYSLVEESKKQITKSANPRHHLSLQSHSLDPCSRKKLEDIRSRYQYLQSQLAEVETRLHLDWAAFINEKNKKKKQDLPVSETLYQALKKSHNLRRVCERRVDDLCDQLKTMHISLLSGTHWQYEDDEALNNLEKTLRETSLTSPPAVRSPFKMLPENKQDKLQRLLDQRDSIPIRRYSNFPKLDLTCLENMSSTCSQDGSVDSSVSASVQPTFPGPAGQSWIAFGPPKFSTPSRPHAALAGGSTTEELSRDLLPNEEESQRSEENAQVFAPKEVSVEMKPPMPTISQPLFKDASLKTAYFGASTLEGSFTSAPKSSTSTGISEPCGPQYEDITPPETPDTKPVISGSSASPLLALSSLVSKVPTTTTTQTTTLAPAPFTSTKTNFSGFMSNTSMEVKKEETAAAPSQPSFMFQPVTSATAAPKPLVASSTPFSFSFSPAGGTLGSSTEATPLKVAGSSAAPANLSFPVPSTTTASSGANTGGVVNMLSFMTSSASTSSSSIFNINSTKFESVQSAASGACDTTVKSSETKDNSLATTTTATTLSSLSGSLFTSPSSTNVGLLEIEAKIVAETDSSSSSADSDTASNATVVQDNHSSSGTSESVEVQEKSSNVAAEEEKAAVPSLEGFSFKSATPVFTVQTSEDNTSDEKGPKPTLSVLPSSSTSLFATPTISSGSLFGGIKTTTPVSSSVEIGTTATTSSGSIFGGASSVFKNTATSGSIFGVGGASSSMSGGSIFAAPTTSTAAKSLFSMVTTTASTGSLFGGGASGGEGVTATSDTTPTVTSSNSGAAGMFSSTSLSSNLPSFSSMGLTAGKTTSTTAAPSTSLFSTPAATTPSSAAPTSPFSMQTPASSSASTFGQSSIFGGGGTTASTGSAFSSLSSPSAGFGQTPSSEPSAFGQPASQGSIFGQAAQSSTGSVFGGSSSGTSLFTSTSKAGGSIFGNAPDQSTSMFGGPAQPAQPAPTALFGQPSSPAASPFSQPTSTPSSPFSSSSTSKPESSIFGSSAGGFGSGGGMFSGLGGGPSPENANKNIFGNVNFTDAKPQASLFGGSSSTSSFGGEASGGSSSGAGNGGFSAGSGSVSQSGFALGSTQPQSGFGGASVFGGAPSGSSSPFGGQQAPAFGSPPKLGSSTFGGSATFGSMGASSGGGFGSFAKPGGGAFGAAANTSQSSSSGFGNFAAQNSTATFGGLAQQSTQASPFPAAGSSMFASGSSFSSWR